jgi:plastocyanin
MGIAILYFAPGPTAGCTSYSSPQAPPSQADRVTVELLKQPSGPLRRNLRGTWVGDYAFGAQRVSLRVGSSFTWRFRGGVEHDVTLASGPAGFASPSMKQGSYTYRFSRPGTYRLFCSLHPAQMTQMVTVH